MCGSNREFFVFNIIAWKNLQHRRAISTIAVLMPSFAKVNFQCETATPKLRSR
jgi:hypothetical protein